MVSYLLAPNSPASESLPTLRKLLEKVLNVAEKEWGSVTLVGDSAGGNVALSLAFSYAKGLIEDGVNSRFPKNVLIISPPTDLRNQNPAIDQADRHDPILTKALIDSAAATWAGDLPRHSPELSPVLDDFNAIKRAEIRIHGVAGTFDLLSPDGLLFREMCQKEDVFDGWMIWEGQMHCFPLAAM
jgi:acetyl esterase/lipase